ncbi:MAG TPA: immunoglobulin domain-containing protein, partial [Opitutaceae bacterium]|nr:immunoglobulin domain-containing protein [Opitutaceae bacterium]
TDGTIATTLGTTTGGSDQVYALSVQADGKLLVGGGFTTFAGMPATNLLRLNTDGTIDTSFSPYPTLANMMAGDIQYLAIDASGHIYFQANATPPFRYARLNANGSPDLTFAAGTTVLGQVLTTARSPDGRIFAAGFFTGVNGATRVGLAAFHADGSLDTTFAPNVGIPWVNRTSGLTAIPTSAQIAFLADGSVLLAGSFNSIGSLNNPGVAHFLANGTLDTAFAPVFNPGDYVSAVAPVSGGGWAIGGSFSSVNGSPRSNVAGFLPSGALDPAYGVASGTNGAVSLLIPRPSGGLYVAGLFSEVGANRNDSLAALNTDGTADTTFEASGISTNTLITSVSPETDGHVLVVSEISNLTSLARLEASGATDLTYAMPSLVGTNMGPSYVTAATVDSSGRALVAVTETVPATPSRGISFGPPSYYNFLIRFDAAGNLDPTFVTNGLQSDAPITGLTIGSDGLLAATGCALEYNFYNNTGGYYVPTPPLGLFDEQMVSGLILIPNATESVTVAPVITSQPTATTAAPGAGATFDAGATGVGLSYQWQLNGSVIAGATGSHLTISDADLANVGTYTVTVSNAAGSVTSTSATLLLSGPPVIVMQPLAQEVAEGASTSFSVTAEGSTPLTYQWSLNGNPIPGATATTLALNYVSHIQGGSYTVIVTNAQGSVISSTAGLVVDAALKTSRLTNLSARAYVAPGQNAADILIAGFVLAGPGTGAQQIVMRGIGPALASFQVADYLDNPELTFFSGSSQGGSATSWDANFANIMASVGAFALTPGSHDDVLVARLIPGPYTAQVTSTDSKPGVALAEIYDAFSPGDSIATDTFRMINLSARAYVGTGSNILIGGFVITGSARATVMIRAVGPTLSTFSVAGVMANPVLTVFDSASPSRVIATNTGWQTAPVAGDSPVTAGVQSASAQAMASVHAFAFGAGSADSAMVLTLPPGSYTAQVTGSNGTTGVALVEIYEVP